MGQGWKSAFETEILNFFSSLTGMDDLDAMLDYIVSETRRLLYFNRCSIYLRPEFVRQFTGEIEDDNGVIRKVNPQQEDIIVLAQTSYEPKKRLIGRGYYLAGEDLTGWVYQKGEVLSFQNAWSPEELQKIDPQLIPSRRYNTLEVDEDLVLPRPISYFPLITKARTIGVLKFHQPEDANSFDPKARKIGEITARVIAGVIEKTQVVKEQGKIILNLAELGAKDDFDEVCMAVSRNLNKLLECPSIEIYLWDPDSNRLVLRFHDGQKTIEPDFAGFERGQGVVGWVFQTEKPLRIGDLKKMEPTTWLTDDLLRDYSDDAIIDDEDRPLHLVQYARIRAANHAIPIMAVPIMVGGVEAVGVLCAHYLRKKLIKVSRFGRVDVERLKVFAGILALAYQNERTRKKSSFLLRLSQLADLQGIFDLVEKRLPEIVSNADCFIYQYMREEGQPSLQLKSCNRGQAALSYQIGEGKTGFCALAEATVVFSHYGSGAASAQKIERRKIRISEKHPTDLVEDLRDKAGSTVGLVQVWGGEKCPASVKDHFKRLAAAQILSDDTGLPTPYRRSYNAVNSKPSFSFLAVPIHHEETNLHGVITLTRPVKRLPFLSSEIKFVEAIAGTLSHLIHNLLLQEERNRLNLSLAHEIHTPLIGLQADIKNILSEELDHDDLMQLNEHMNIQVENLALLAQTTLRVLSTGPQASMFSLHKIYRPVKEAIEMFRDEARQKGIEIKPFVTLDGLPFPDIEMNLPGMTMAFKNLVQNAVKYSFRTPPEREKLRYIKIEGEYADEEQTRYTVSIQNFGVGITPEEIEKRLIFQPFYRGTNASILRRTGAGLGLSYVAEIIEKLHHGEIHVTSSPVSSASNRAFLTTFKVTLPLMQPVALKTKEVGNDETNLMD